jgi:hypothetical protein
MQYRITLGGRVKSAGAHAGRPYNACTLITKTLGRGRPCRADTLAAFAALGHELDTLAFRAGAVSIGHAHPATARGICDQLNRLGRALARASSAVQKGAIK